jgi:hypothetical protein
LGDISGSPSCDERPAVVLDDVQNANFSGFRASVADGVPVFVKITNTRKRKADREYVKDSLQDHDC